MTARKSESREERIHYAMRWIALELAGQDPSTVLERAPKSADLEQARERMRAVDGSPAPRAIGEIMQAREVSDCLWRVFHERDGFCGTIRRDRAMRLLLAEPLRGTRGSFLEGDFDIALAHLRSQFLLNPKPRRRP